MGVEMDDGAPGQPGRRARALCTKPPGAYNRLIAEATGQTYEKVAEDTDRNYWMSAAEAIEYGVVGQLIQSLVDLRD
jgi:ATP-dependent protease ClpP protease subunit